MGPATRLIARCGDERVAVEIEPTGEIRVDRGELLTVAATEPGAYRVSSSSHSWRVYVAYIDQICWVFCDGQIFKVQLEPADGGPPPRSSGQEGALTAPMPATVASVLVIVGQFVTQGEPVILLEAMKMELPIRAPHAGTITAIHCRAGDLVQPGVSLMELK